MDTLHELVTVIENSHVKRARERGQKIVGYACLATPREILDAAGIFPIASKLWRAVIQIWLMLIFHGLTAVFVVPACNLDGR